MNDSKNNQIGKRLKQYRLEREWTLKQLAQVVRLSPSTLWYIEEGKKNPHDLTLHKLSKALPGLFELATSD